MSEYAGWIDGGATGAEALGKVYNKFFTPGSAIILNPASHQVTERGAGQNMSVDIAPGAGLSDLADYSIPVWSNAIVNKVVSAADPTNPRKDIVVRYVSLSSFGATNNVGALKFIIVAGTPAGSPTDPSDATIQAAVGAGNPWEKLARITLPANATTVVNAYITDMRQPVAFAGALWGGSSNTNGHTIPNVADDTLELLGANQTITGNKTFSGQVNINSFNIAGAWQPWTPTYANLSVGNGSVVSKYQQIGKTVNVIFKFTLGTTSTIGTTPAISFPVTPHSDYFTEQTLGLADFIQTGTGDFTGRAYYDSSTPSFKFRDIVTPSGSNPVNLLSNSGNQLTATAPFTWASTHILATTFSYEAA